MSVVDGAGYEMVATTMEDDEMLPPLVEHTSPILAQNDMNIIHEIFEKDRDFMNRAVLQPRYQLQHSSVTSNSLLSCPATDSVILDTHAFVEEARLERNYNKRVAEWEKSGNWATPQTEYATIIVQQLRQLPSASKFRDGDNVFESAIGGGRFASVVRGMVRATSDENAHLNYYGSDLVDAGALDLSRRLIPDGQFCIGDSQDLSWVPTNWFDWAITSYVEPLPYSLGGNELRNQERWFRWWVYNIARISKPSGWLIVAFVRRTETYSSTCGGIGCGVEPAFFRESEQMRLWQVDPLSVKVIKTNDEWPARKYLKGRYHVVMQRTADMFPSTPCAHVYVRDEMDLDYINNILLECWPCILAKATSRNKQTKSLLDGRCLCQWNTIKFLL